MSFTSMPRPLVRMYRWTTVPSGMVPKRSRLTSRRPEASEAVTPSSPTVAAASAMATAIRTALLPIPPLAAVLYMDPPFRCPYGHARLAGSQQMVDHQLVESFVAAAAAGGGLGVEAALFAQLLEGLARPERGGGEVRHAGRGHGLGDLRVGS